jgi:glyoxylase-like metal-dependent hydrolase (beta-lactamase superfamily II)
MSAGGLLVERDGRTLLIDAGFGPQTAETPLGPVNSGALPDTLAALGHDPAGIDTVAFTHLHVDHTGWAFTRNPDGTWRKTFPAARFGRLTRTQAGLRAWEPVPTTVLMPAPRQLR